MATLYFNAAINNNWNELGNWWLDDSFATPATSLPTSGDDVYVRADVSSNSGSTPTVNNLTVDGSGYAFSISININNAVTFDNGSYNAGSVTAPNAMIAGSSTSSYNSGTITSSSVYFGGADSYNSGTIVGNVDFVGSYSYNSGSVTGAVTFYGASTNNRNTSGGSISGNVTFDGSSRNEGNITGDVTFNYSSEFVGGTITGNASFYGTSVFNTGTVTGNVTVYYDHPIPFIHLGTINGSLLYSGYSPRTVYFYHTGSSEDWGGNFWYTASAGGGSSTYAPNPDIILDNVIIEASVGSNTGNLDATVGSLTVDGLYVASTFVSINITCDYANFNDSCYLNTGATLTQSVNHGGNNITFSDLSENDGTVNPDTPPVVFEDSASNDGTVNGDVDVYYPSEKPVGGTVTGFVTYYGYTLYFGGGTNDGNWNNPNNWFLDSANSNGYGDIPSDTMPYQNVIIQSNLTSSQGQPAPGTIDGSPTAYDLNTANYYTYISNISITVDNLATFNDETYLDSSATITGNVLFEDLATNRGGIVTGTATFTLSSAEEMISNGYDGTYGDIEFQYGKGVNGSSILGIV